MRLRDKIAIVTGAGAGFGRGIATLFAREGAAVVVADVDRKTGAETVELVQRTRGHAVFVEADVSRASDAERVAATAIREFGGIHVVVNDAAICRLRSVIELGEEEWDRHMAVNLKGPWLVSRAALPHMVAARAGAIVNVASLAGTKARPFLAAYAASKGGVIMLTQQMAVELAPYNVRCNCISPVFGDTPMGESLLAQGTALYGVADVRRVRDTVIQGIPLGRAARPEDIAYGALYLASDESSLVTGINLIIDGGAHA